ncbi:MAG TPA: copper resistance CopC family protein [Jatrophihabitantaceae bacterium]|nr:copper resistance CopC family protein [Jatrophihabitantaceae bacterium]
MRAFHRVVAFLVSVAFVVGVLLVAPTSVSAHDELLSSNPANGAALHSMPVSVVLTFEEPPADGYTKVAVLAADGTDVSSGSVLSDGARVTRAIRSGLASGAYTVKFSILSDDGHPVSGVIRFTVAAGAEQQSPAPATAAEGGSGRWLLWLIGGVVVLAVAFGAMRVLSPAPSTRVRG